MPKRGKKRKPVMLLFHGGGFTEGDGSSLADAKAMARRKGFKPKVVNYTLGDLNQAVKDAKRAASSYGDKRTVVAYGESAGGTLASLLAQRGKVDAAVSYMGPSNLNQTFNNPLLAEHREELGASRKLLRRFSPNQRDSENPILMQIARDDLLVNPASQRKWARRDPMVRAQMVEGNHVYAPEPTDRKTQLRSAMRYLRGI